MLKIGDWASTFMKINVRFETSTFKTDYIQNFVKIRKLILFGPKYPNMENWAHRFCTQMKELTNFVKIRKLILFIPKYLNLGIWAQNFQAK